MIGSVVRALDPAVCVGTTRVALLVGPWAVKVPRVSASGHGRLWGFAHGVLANLSERRISARDDIEGIAPVLWSLAGLVQLYPRCDPAPYEPHDYSLIASPGVPVDPRPHNVGVLDDELVFVDYAEAGECATCARWAARP